MAIDHTKVIRGCVEPRLAYHGFKYDEQRSKPAHGVYSFTRHFFGKLQKVTFYRGSYRYEDLAGLLAKGYDIPTKALGGEPGVDEPLWLSNRLVHASVRHEDFGFPIRHGPELEGGADWEYRTEGDLRRVLKAMVEVVLTEALDWFEKQVAEIRRHHEKLDARLAAEKERREARGRALTPSTRGRREDDES